MSVSTEQISKASDLAVTRREFDNFLMGDGVMLRFRNSWLHAVVLGLSTGWMLSTAQGEQSDKEKVDPSGTWKWERTFGDNTMKFVLRLRLDGENVVGTRTLDSLNGLSKVEIHNGKMDGDTVSFQYDVQFNDAELTVKYRGKVAEDTIKGDSVLSSDQGEREFDWEAKRSTELADVLGTWQFRIETPNGNVLEPSITISKEGDKVKGDYVSRSAELDATDIKLKDNVLTFQVSGENNGNQFTVVYKGKPRGDSIKGTIDYDFNENTGTIDFMGKRQREKDKDKTE